MLKVVFVIGLILAVFAFPSLLYSSSWVSSSLVNSSTKMYVSSYSGTDSMVSVIEGKNVIATINLKGTICCKMAYDPTDSELFLPNNGGYDPLVYVISTITDKLVANITGFTNPVAAQYVPTVGKVFVADRGINKIFVIDPVTNKVVSSFSHGLDHGYRSPSSLAYSPATNELYMGTIANFGKDLRFLFSFNPKTYKEAAILPDGQVTGMVFDPANNDLFAAHIFGHYDSMSIYITIFNSNNELVKSLKPIPKCCSGFNIPEMAYNPTNHMVYLTDGKQTVYLINDRGSIVGRVTGFSAPAGIAYDPSNQLMYVTNYGNGTVQTISGTTVESTISLGSTAKPDCIITG